MKSYLYKLLGIRSDAEKLFYNNEYRALAWRTSTTFWWLLLILLFMFLALGFAFGSWQNLQKRMRDPFTNWVSMDIIGANERQTPLIQQEFDDSDQCEAYNLKNMSQYHEFWIDIWHHDFNPYRTPPDSLLFRLTGRTISPEEEILQSILDPKSGNVVVNHLIEDEQGQYVLQDCDLILEADKLSLLGYNDLSALKNVPLEYFGVPMLARVGAVVNDLPSQYNFICTPRFHNIFEHQITREQGLEYRCRNLIKSNRVEGTVYQAIISQVSVGNATQAARQFFGRRLTSFDAHQPQEYPGYSAIHYSLHFSSNQQPDENEWKNFLHTLRSGQIEISDFAYMESGTDKCNTVSAPNYVAFNFKDLYRIRAFRDHLKKKYAVEIDMDQVETKDNFSRVTLLTIVVCVALTLLGVFCVLLYVNNLLESHLQEIKPNLGTFQAFGLSERFLSKLYRQIIFVFLASASIGALFIAFLVDRIEEIINGKNSYFTVFSWVIPVALLAVFVFSIGWTWLTIRRTVGDTPGNLIYGR